MRLFILGQEIELKDDGKLAQTKQVNDILSLSTRQTNYTNSFSIPRTAKNIRTFEGLGIIGNDSNIPYQKNVASLFSDSGECFVFEGWAIISDTAKDFKCNIYDGNLEVYKVIENKTLADLDLADLSHSKTTAEVVSTFDNSKPYKYIVADYNGLALYDTDKINIDSLVPSVKVSWLVDKIETYSGFTFNGSFKTNADYLNLFMTYPKGTPSDLGTTDMVVINDFLQGLDHIFINSYTLLTDFSIIDDIKLKSNTNQSTNISISLDVVVRGENNQNAFDDNISVDVYAVLNGVEIYLGNTTSIATFSFNKSLSVNDELYFIIKPSSGIYVSFEVISGGFTSLIIKKYNSFSIDFLDELKGMTMRDFLNEIIWRFGLTLFKEKYSNVYDFKTISEITNFENTIDWSSKFVSKESEKYIFGSYAQNNLMRYKYNDDNANHNDSYLAIDNKNLDDSKTIIQSKIYSPELSFSNSLGFTSKVYKLWDKEPKDDGTTTYKALANRFYFMRSIENTFATTVTIGSPSLLTSQTITAAPIESFAGLTFAEIISKYYPDIKKILNKSQVLNVRLNLKDSDVSDIDFSVPYYFKQLGGSFMLNKISNFVPNKETTVELIRLNNL